MNTRARDQLIDRFYVPHHQEFFRLCETELREFGKCLIVDCHSFPDKPLQYELDQNPDRPDICIGTDDFHTPTWLSEFAAEQFDRRGYRVELNRPFAGAIVPAQFYHSEPRVASIMIELNRTLYMDSVTGAVGEGFERTQSDLAAILAAISARHKQY